MASRSNADDKNDAAAPDLAAEVAELRAEIETVLTHLRKIGSDGVETAKAGARDEWHAVEEKLEREMRERPWHTLGFAALAGLVLGLILRR